jgi:hypothetical protein
VAENEDKRKRLVIAGGSLLATGLLAWLAFALGAWGFGYRRFSHHHGRLERLLPKQPELEQLVQAFREEGTALVAAPRGDAELLEAASARGGRKREEVVAKGRQYRYTRVFLAGDMVYFVFFDQDRVMRDFTLVSR